MRRGAISMENPGVLNNYETLENCSINRKPKYWTRFKNRNVIDSPLILGIRRLLCLKKKKNQKPFFSIYKRKQIGVANFKTEHTQAPPNLRQCAYVRYNPNRFNLFIIAREAGLRDGCGV